MAEKPLQNGAELEDILGETDSLLRFREFLGSIYSAENFDFWLEAETFKNIPEGDPQQATRAKEIFNTYFAANSESPVNIDDASQEEELKEKMKNPNKETFLKVQNTAWGLLKFECYPRFKTSPYFTTPLNKKQKEAIKKQRIYKYLNELVKTVKKSKKAKTEAATKKDEDGDKKPGIDEEKLYDLPDIEEIFDDEEMMLAFREYLYRTIANENLSFWLEAELFRHIKDKAELKETALKIYDKFCTPDSPYPVNIDFNLRKTIKDRMEKPTTEAFREAQKITWKVLKNEWFPEFLASEVYKECNEERVEYKKSSTKRERGNTIYSYEQIVKLKEEIEDEGRDFVAEINEEIDVNNPQKHKKSNSIGDNKPVTKSSSKENLNKTSPRDNKSDKISPRDAKGSSDKSPRDRGDKSPRNKDSDDHRSISRSKDGNGSSSKDKEHKSSKDKDRHNDKSDKHSKEDKESSSKNNSSEKNHTEDNNGGGEEKDRVTKKSSSRHHHYRDESKGGSSGSGSGSKEKSNNSEGGHNSSSRSKEEKDKKSKSKDKRKD